MGLGRCAWLIGLVGWLGCVALGILRPITWDEPVLLRLVRRWEEHPLQVVAAGALLTWALGGWVRGVPAAVPLAVPCERGREPSDLRGPAGKEPGSTLS